MIILVIAFLMFGLPVSLMNLSRDEDRSLMLRIFNGWFIDTLINQYLVTLGEFPMLEVLAGDGLETEFITAFFIGATFFTQITMLNMLIAIMGDIFDQCTELRDRLDVQNRLSILRTQSAVI